MARSIEWTAHDFDNDGWIDILGGAALHYNARNMTFAHDATAPANGPIGDLNNDGFLDVVNGASARISNGNDNNWIVVRTIGVVSNKNGIGARVTVTSALGSQIRDVKSGDGFEYMSTINAHFGIGDDVAITSVTVEWPSGIVDVIEDPAINGTLTVVEGLSTAVDDEGLAHFSILSQSSLERACIERYRCLGEQPGEHLDVTGKLVLSTQSRIGKVDVSDLMPGVYQLVVVGPDGFDQARFTKE